MPELDSRLITELIELHNGPIAQAGRAANLATFDDTRSWIDPNGYRLSDRLWRQRGEVRKAIDARIRFALANGEDAIQTARALERFLDPTAAPRRTARGRIVLDQRPGVLTETPRGGQGSYPARRLTRTETTRAHGQTALQVAERIGAKVKWALSAAHPRVDICDEHAQRDEGYGPGIYDVRDVPQYPPHPQCLCTLSSAVIETDEQLVERLRKKYGLGTSNDD